MKTRATEIEILPRSARVPTWRELRAALPEQLQAGRLVSLPYGGGRRVVLDDDALVDDGNYVLEIEGETVTGISIHETESVDVEAFADRVDAGFAGDWLAAGRSWGVFVRPSGEWRALAVALARLVNGTVLIEPDFIDVAPGLYSPEQLAA